MLLIAKPQEPAWTPVMGAEVLFAPIDRPMLLRARAAARKVSEEIVAAEGDALVQIEEMGDALSRALILEGAKDWRGVCRMEDAADDGAGEPLPFSREHLELALSDPLTFEAFDAAYVVPFMLRERERAAPGNGSAASPSGTGEAAMPANGTAISAASRKKSVGAARARTSSTKRKPKPKKASGAS